MRKISLVPMLVIMLLASSVLQTFGYEVRSLLGLANVAFPLTLYGQHSYVGVLPVKDKTMYSLIGADRFQTDTAGTASFVYDISHGSRHILVEMDGRESVQIESRTNPSSQVAVRSGSEELDFSIKFRARQDEPLSAIESDKSVENTVSISAHSIGNRQGFAEHFEAGVAVYGNLGGERQLFQLAAASQGDQAKIYLASMQPVDVRAGTYGDSYAAVNFPGSDDLSNATALRIDIGSAASFTDDRPRESPGSVDHMVQLHPMFERQAKTENINIIAEEKLKEIIETTKTK